MKEKLADILDKCLTAIEKGVSLESCLGRHPELKEELESLLKVAFSLRKTSPAKLTASVKKALWQKIALRLALDSSLEAMDKGASLQECLKSHPHLQKELKPLLKAAMAYREVNPAVMNLKGRRTLWQRIFGPLALEESLEEVEGGVSLKESLAKYPRMEKELKPLLETAVSARKTGFLSLGSQSKAAMWRRLSAKLQKVPTPAPTLWQRAQQWAGSPKYEQLTPAFAAVLALAVAGVLIFSMLAPSSFVSRTPVDGKVSLAKLSPEEVSPYLKKTVPEKSGAVQATAGGAAASSEGGGEGTPSEREPSEGSPTPSAPTNLVAYAGNLENNLSWQAGSSSEVKAAASGKVAGYNIYRSASEEGGPYTKVNKSLVAGTSYDDPIAGDALDVYYYKIQAVGKNGKQSGLSEACAASMVSITTTCYPNLDNYIVASTGELMLRIPAGALSETTTITIREKMSPGEAPSDTDEFITSIYDFGPAGLTFSGGNPARLTLAYNIGVQSEQFETDWLANTAKLYYYDENDKAWKDASDDLSLDPVHDTISSDLTHFTDYAPGFTWMPHGRYSPATDLCSVCHDSHSAGGGTISKRENVDLCFYCHGNVNSSQGAAGAHGGNVQAEFLACSNQTFNSNTDSRHPAYTNSASMVCGDCHTPHRDPNKYSHLVYQWNQNGSRTYYSQAIGNVFCWGCHGTWKNTYLFNAPSYYSNTGGNHETGYATSAHGSRVFYTPAATVDSTCAINAGSTQIQCLVCHAEHGAKTASHMTALRQGSGKNQEALCFSCHNNTTTSWNSRNVQAEFNRLSHHDVTGATGATLECASCHNSHLVQTGASGSYWQYGRASNPDNTKQTPTGWLAFCVTCHNGSPPSATVTTTSLVPYTVSFQSVSSYPFFPGWDKSTYTSSAHKGNIGDCNVCHDPHGSDFKRLMAMSWVSQRQNTVAANSKEENMCFYCHDGAAKDVWTSFNKTYHHPITVADVHADTEVASGLGTGKRHAECFDCHDPHKAKVGAHTAGTNAASNLLIGVGGVSASYSGTGAASGYTTVNPITREYQLCYKCHSAYVTLPGTSPNLTAYFNPNNPSYHPVESVGRNTSIGASAFTSSWTATSKMYCSDCHTSSTTAVKGPHGSDYDSILERAVDTASRTTESSYLCYKCHNYNVYYKTSSNPTTAFRKSDNTNLHYKHVSATGSADMNCRYCHTPHGSSTRQRLIYTSSKFTNITFSAGNYTMASCTTSGCHGSNQDCYTCHGASGTNGNIEHLMGRGGPMTAAVGGGAKTYHHVMSDPTNAYTGTSSDAPTTSLSKGNTCMGRCHALHSEHTGNTASGALSLRQSNNEKGLCLYCHDTGKVYPGKTITSASYVNSAHNYQTTGGTENRWNSTVAGVAYDYQKNCTKCHAPHGSNVKHLINEVIENKPGGTTQAVSNGTKEAVCLTCHGSDVTRTGMANMSTAFNKTYRHNIFSGGASSVAHSAGTEPTSALSGSNRHVECQDCHNIHQAQSGAHTLGSTAIGNVLKGVWGLSVSYTGGAWTTASYTVKNTATYEYEVCYKCHSQWTWGSNPPNATIPTGALGTQKQTELSKEFNPNNLGYHPLMTVGKNQPSATLNSVAWETLGISGSWTRAKSSGTALDADYTGLDNTFVPPFEATSLVTCSDCHGSNSTSDPGGPHGSTEKWILNNVDTSISYTRKDGVTVYYTSGTNTSTKLYLGLGTNEPKNFCLNCHRGDIYGWSKTDLTKTTAAPWGNGTWSPDKLSRLSHSSNCGWSSTRCNDGTTSGGNAYNISCMCCHGGDANPNNTTDPLLGGVHGSNQGTGGHGTASVGTRLINGASWNGHDRDSGPGSGGTQGSCYADNANGINACNRHGTGVGYDSNYSY